MSPIGPLPELGYGSRKRSYEEDVQEPAAKRHMPMAYHTQPQLPVLHATPTAQVSHSHPQTLHPPATGPTLPLPAMSNSHPAHLSLPGARAMSLVYNAPRQAQPQPQASQAMHVPPLQTSGLPSALHPDHQRQLSPFPFSSATASPVHAVYTPTGQTGSRLSPSYFLQQRSSPYRPVRSVQTLLAPPSSTPSYNAPRMVTYDHLQYHPLGRPLNERRVGHLPCLEHAAWPQSHQFNQWSEVVPPPQPNFYG